MRIRNNLLRVFGMGCTLVTLGRVQTLYAFPQEHWVLQSGEQLEVLRDFVCFGEGRAAQRSVYKTVTFSKEVLSAEVFISGFNVWQTRGGDTEVTNLRIDAFVRGIGLQDPDPPHTVVDKQKVNLEFMYALTDKTTHDPEDFNDSCIGFTVIAKTR